MLTKDGLSFSKIILAVGRSDLRRGVDGLAAEVRLKYGLNPLEKDTLFLFCGTRKDYFIRSSIARGLGFSFKYQMHIGMSLQGISALFNIIPCLLICAWGGQSRIGYEFYEFIYLPFIFFSKFIG